MANKWNPEEYVTRTLARRETGRTVLDMALDRIRHTYSIVDHVVVSFSGGKDSTCVLNLALMVARELGRLPLEVVFWDEEAIHPETIAYMHRVRADPDVRLRWLCLPVEHVNACSRRQPTWHPWHPREKHLWCRPMPDIPELETKLAGFRWKAIPESHHLPLPRDRVTALLLGIRADESLRRLMSVSRREEDNYIAWEARDGRSYALVKPIYDWRHEDVWLAQHQFGWDYNRAYDLMEKHGMASSTQRVAPPFGAEPMQNLHMYATCFPELWEKMCRRVPGAATAARYSRTELYGFGGAKLPAGKTWKQHIEANLAKWEPAARKIMVDRVRWEIENHYAMTTDPIPDEVKHPITGVSWRYLAMLSIRGDLKGRKRAMFKGKDKARPPVPDSVPDVIPDEPIDPIDDGDELGRY